MVLALFHFQWSCLDILVLGLVGDPEPGSIILKLATVGSWVLNTKRRKDQTIN